MSAMSLSAVCYLTLAGENEQDFLLYLDGMIDSLSAFWRDGEPLPLVFICPADEVAYFRRAVAPVPRLRFEFLSEHAVAPSLATDRLLVADRRDMAARLLYAASGPTDFCLTLEPGVFCVRPIAADMLTPQGRALTEWESKTKHAAWWRGSARLLAQPAGGAAMGLGVCPAILARDLARRAVDAVAAASGHDPVKALAAATAGEPESWTDNAIYSLANEGAALLAWHWDPDAWPAGQPNRLHADANLWRREDLRGWDPEAWRALATHGDFVIVKRRAGIAPDQVLPTLYRMLDLRA
jgi:Family of unknown function (DUF6492)